MNDIKVKDEIVKTIINIILLKESKNQIMPQSQRLSDTDMIKKHMETIKNELVGEKEKLK